MTLHFELGRAVVGQCGSLISKVIYVKQGTNKQFAILDAGMTDLIRPALYQACYQRSEYHGKDDGEEGESGLYRDNRGSFDAKRRCFLFIQAVGVGLY